MKDVVRLLVQNRWPFRLHATYDESITRFLNATRVASYNPWVSLYWLVTGKTAGGTTLYPKENRLDRMEALRLFTTGSAWFSRNLNLS